MSDAQKTLGSLGREERLAVEIVCGMCGVRSIGADPDAACRAYALHMYTAHGRTVSYSDGRALARPLDRRVLAARGS